MLAWEGLYEGRRALFPPGLVKYEHLTCDYCANVLNDQSKLDQLVSEAGIDIQISRGEFKSAIQDGCGICVPLYENLRSSPEEDIKPFWVFDGEEAAKDEHELVLNYHASTVPRGHRYDISEMKVAPLGRHKRGNNDQIFDVYADHGNTYSSRISGFLEVALQGLTV
jgi:hypothetical protein